MNTELDRYISNLDALIRKLSPAERRKLSTDIARKMRQSNQSRMRANIEPGGQPYLQRKGEPTRNLRKNEKITVGKEFYYFGEKRQMRTIKTAATAQRRSRITTQPYESEYIWGYEFEAGGIRKFKKSRIKMPALRHKRMFTKINSFKYLKQKVNDHQAAIGFMSGLTGYIAAAHQYGEGSRPARQLLGFSDGDLRLIEETVVQHLAASE